MQEQSNCLYNPNLGRKHGAGALGEESAVISALLSRGGTGWWVPDAAVEHWIPKERQTINYLRNYDTLVGKTYYRWDPYGAPTLWGRRRLLWPKAVQAEIAYNLARLSRNPDR